MLAPLLAAVLTAAPSNLPKTMDLGVGSQKLLEIPGISKIAVGDPSVADVKPLDGKQLLIVGKGKGNTTLLVWTGANHLAVEMQLHVRELNPEDGLGSTLHQLLPGADLEVHLLGDKWVVQGRVYSLADLRKLHALVDGDANVLLLVDLERSAQHRLVERINAELHKQGLRDAKAELVGSEIFLEGHVDDEADAHRAQLIAESISAAQP